MSMNFVSSSVRCLCLSVAVGVAVGACSKEASTPTTPSPPTASNPPNPAADVPANPSQDVDPTKPPNPTPPPAGPTSNDPKDYPGLKIESVKAGEGKELVMGKKAKVRYIGTLVNGKEFDSSWKRGTDPIEFPLDGVVPGFRVGLLGMKVGEQRRLTIPGEFAYKEAGSPGAGIGPNETLFFDVELVDVVD